VKKRSPPVGDDLDVYGGPHQTSAKDSGFQ
jgi:hypothetical protein